MSYTVSSLQNICVSWFWQLFKRSKNFFLETKIVSIKIIDVIYILRLFSWEWLLCLYYIFFVNKEIKKNYIIFDSRNFLVDADQNATFSLLTNTIFLHPDRQLSQWFYTFERDMQVWHTEIGNFHDDFMFLIEWRHFYTKICTFPDEFMTRKRYAIFIG